MKVLVQRVLSSSIVIKEEKVASIGRGTLCLIGFEKGDSLDLCLKLLKRVVAYRMFSDNEGKMNLSLKDIEGDILLVPQVTLAINTRKGNRPSFSTSASPDESRNLFEKIKIDFKKIFNSYQTGVFGEDMQIELINEGPVTFMFET